MADDRRAHTWFAIVHPHANRQEARQAAVEFSHAASRGEITQEDVIRAGQAGLCISPIIMSIN